MPTITRHDPGTFCWPELYTTDQNAAKRFYAEMFGWHVRDIPLGAGSVYTIFTLDGRDAAACYGATPEMVQQQVPPHWMAYVSVTSADEAAAVAKAEGGRALKEPFEVMSIGRMAALQDPAGASFCVWEARGHIGVGVLDEPNALMWTELLTHDVPGSEAFYRSVFGWGHRLWPLPDGSNYHLFMRGDAAAGGMMAISPEMGPIQSVWVSYFRVADCDAKASRAATLGGRIEVAPQDVPDVGRFAVLVDPAGAHFGIMQRA